MFRHWFMWGLIERRPGVYDWDDYDRQPDLAAKHGIRTVIASLIHSVPDWAVRKWSHARQVRANGQPLGSHMGVSPATGGFSENGGGAGTLSLDCPEVQAGAFLRALAAHYKGHPGLWAYDIWSECTYAADVAYSPFGKAACRYWLRAKYGTLEALAAVWHRYSYADWDDIEPPTQLAHYPECLDWLRFPYPIMFTASTEWRSSAPGPAKLLAGRGYRARDVWGRPCRRGRAPGGRRADHAGRQRPVCPTPGRTARTGRSLPRRGNEAASASTSSCPTPPCSRACTKVRPDHSCGW